MQRRAAQAQEERDARKGRHAQGRAGQPPGHPSAVEAAKAWERGDAVYVYRVGTDMQTDAKCQARINAQVNSIAAVGWQLQGTATQGDGSLLLGNSIVFTFVRPTAPA